eukprot:TRINITY_DN3999_c0_g2_i1.p1 TRINITY_DN3999_c0_g2~~TRINITY_DN3999_c0_g2_i1.p1  ORF type:complete len:482 (+),score=96.20 TRINITY_DN3999_c0_g2_i1:269-1714(+)
MEAKQILVFGDVQGKLDELYKKIGVVNKKNSFAFAVCVGKFLGDGKSFESYVSGEKKASLPTYFCSSTEDEGLLDPHIANFGGEVCHNIICLGRLSVTTVQGITIAACNFTNASNVKASDPEVSQFLNKYESHSGFSGVDLLVTNEWPKGVLRGLKQEQCPDSGLSMLEYDTFGSSLVTHIAATMVPRYHFSTAAPKQVFYKRAPYENGRQFADGRTYHVTRFISLATAFNTQKKQFMFGIAIAPLPSMDLKELHDKPTDTTPFPYKEHVVQDSATKKQKLDEDQRMLERYAASLLDSGVKPAYAQRKTNGRKNPLTSGARGDECWFCMSSSVCEVHMIITIDTHFYLALAKGPINTSHILLIPVKHTANVLQLSKGALDELWKWKNILTKYFESLDEVVVFYEHNQPGRNAQLQHLHIQAVAMPKLHGKKIREYFEHEASNFGISWNEEDIHEGNVQSKLRAGIFSFSFLLLFVSVRCNP